MAQCNGAIRSPWLAPLEPAARWQLGGLLAIFLIGLSRFWLGEAVHLTYEAGLLFAGVIGILGPSFFAARTRALAAILVQNVAGEEDFSRLHRDFTERYVHGRLPTVIGGLAGLVLCISRLVVYWDLLPYRHDLTRAVMTVVVGIGFAWLSRTICLFIGFAWLSSQLTVIFEQRQERIFSWGLIEACGRGYARTAVGTSLLSLALFWIAITTRQVFGQQQANLFTELMTVSGIALAAAIIPLTYLIIPQWRLHRILVARKEAIRSPFAERLRQIERELLERPSQQLTEAYLHQRQLVGEIDNLPEWPFHFGSVLQVFTVVAIPAGAFLVKEVLVEALIQLLREPR